MASENETNPTSSRLAATVVLWLLLLTAMVLVSIALGPFVGVATVAIPIALTVAGIVLSGFIWNWGQLPDSNASLHASEHIKRNRLTMALRDLSDAELKSLRERLSSGDIDDAQLARLLDDQSEASKAKRY